MKRVPKGSSGYVRYEKVKRALIALLMFAIPLTIFFTGWITTGTRKNLLTIVAILGIIPAARFAVSWIMIMLQKDVPSDVVKHTEEAAGDLVHGYELTVTAYEGRMPLDAVVVRSGSAACLSLNGKKEQFGFMEKHIESILHKNGYKKVKVKIFGEEKSFLERIWSMKKADEKMAPAPEEESNGTAQEEEGAQTAGYGALTRDERILAVIKAISL